MDLVPVKKKASAPDETDYYTCTMHPSVKSKSRGNAPLLDGSRSREAQNRFIRPNF